MNIVVTLIYYHLYDLYCKVRLNLTFFLFFRGVVDRRLPIKLGRMTAERTVISIAEGVGEMHTQN